MQKQAIIDKVSSYMHVTMRAVLLGFIGCCIIGCHEDVPIAHSQTNTYTHAYIGEH